MAKLLTHNEIEGYIYRMTRTALRRQIQPAIDSLQTYGIEYTLGQIDRIITHDQIFNVFNRFYPTIISENAKYQYNILSNKKQSILDLINTFTSTFVLTDVFYRILAITNTTRNRVTRTIQRSIDILEAIQALEASRMTDPHARVIARTEGTTGMQVGRDLGAGIWGNEEGQPVWKKWRTAEDERVRPAHMAMEETRPIPLTSLFIVGGENMKYPGDPNASIGLTANCRCFLNYMPEREVIRLYGQYYVDRFLTTA